MNDNFERGARAELDRKDFERLYANYDVYRRVEHLYAAACEEVRMRLNVLNDEFNVTYQRSPIHHIESRVKSNPSIVAKLRRKGKEISLENALKYVNDMAGIRVVCSYIDDVYAVEEMLMRQKDMELVQRTDYIEKPNFNGYRSLHLDMKVPIFLSDHTEFVLVEIQLRSVAMDFWASLEHDMRYKAAVGTLPEGIDEEMLQMSGEIAAIDMKMQNMYRRIMAVRGEK